MTSSPKPDESARRVAVTRLGPATATSDGVLIGLGKARHVLLTPTGLHCCVGPDERDHLPWGSLVDAHIDAPTTRLRRSGPIVGLFASALGAIGFDWLPSTDDIVVSLETRDGSIEWYCDPHVVVGYWAPHVRATNALLQAAAAAEDVRAGLARPAMLLGRLAAVARSRKETEEHMTEWLIDWA